MPPFSKWLYEEGAAIKAISLSTTHFILINFYYDFYAEAFVEKVNSDY
jgi:hypothetical protein